MRHILLTIATFVATLSVLAGYRTVPARITLKISGQHHRRFRAADSSIPSIPSAQPNQPSGIFQTAIKNFKASCRDMKQRPLKYLSIPISAAIIGYITNWVGVKMLFYPLEWTGLPLMRFGPEQPFGVLGWQGVVPCKRRVMSAKLVDVTITRLLKIQEVFAQLEPARLASILTPIISPKVFNGLVPRPVLKAFVQRASADIIKNSEKVVDVRSIVIGGLTEKNHILGDFFQSMAKKELKFLVDSGVGFGFLLGLLQMLQWMVYPANWTLVAGGSLVGYVTNWIALKWVFEPVYPTKIGPFILQGMFLRRQKEVTADFSKYIADKVLTSQSVWSSMISGSRCDMFRKIVQRNVPLPSGIIAGVIAELKNKIGSGGVHPLHTYCNFKLNLEALLVERMGRLSPLEFDDVLHPIFKEDELTLILAGAVLGALSGGLQWYFNIQDEKKRKAETSTSTTGVSSSSNTNVVIEKASTIVVNESMDAASSGEDGEVNTQQTRMGDNEDKGEADPPSRVADVNTEPSPNNEAEKTPAEMLLEAIDNSAVLKDVDVPRKENDEPLHADDDSNDSDDSTSTPP